MLLFSHIQDHQYIASPHYSTKSYITSQYWPVSSKRRKRLGAYPSDHVLSQAVTDALRPLRGAFTGDRIECLYEKLS